MKTMYVPITEELLVKRLRQDFESAGINLDADTDLYIAREVQYVMKKTYDVQYPDWSARKLFPVNNEVDPGAQDYIWYSFDKRGIAKIVSNYSTDFPRVSLNKKTNRGLIKTLGDSYGYSIKDMMTAKMAGLPLDARLAKAAKEGVLQKENQIAFNGDSDNSLPGFLTNPNISNVTLTADGTGASTLFVNKTALQILRDILSLKQTITRLTKGIEKPNTLLLPPEKFDALEQPSSAYVLQTILNFMAENWKSWLKEIISVPELSGAGIITPGLDIMVMYDKNPDKLGLITPLDFMQLPPQMENAEWNINCMSMTGGVPIYYPLSVATAEGI